MASLIKSEICCTEAVSYLVLDPAVWLLDPPQKEELLATGCCEKGGILPWTGAWSLIIGSSTEGGAAGYRLLREGRYPTLYWSLQSDYWMLHRRRSCWLQAAARREISYLVLGPAVWLWDPPKEVDELLATGCEKGRRAGGKSPRSFRYCLHNSNYVDVGTPVSTWCWINFVHLAAQKSGI